MWLGKLDCDSTIGLTGPKNLKHNKAQQNISMVILSLLLIQEEQLSVFYWLKITYGGI